MDPSLEFQRQCQVVSANVQKITQNVANLKDRSADDSSKNDTEQLHTLLHYTEQLAKDTAVSLKQLKEDSLPRIPHSEQRQARLQCDRLNSDFIRVLSEFQSVQRKVAAVEKARIKKVKAGTGFAAPYVQEESESGNIDLSSGISGRQQQQQLTDLGDLEEKEAALRRLEDDIQGVNEIFKNLATMVHEQGEVVDTIEANVETAHVQVETAVGQLHQASRYKSAARKRMVCMIVTAVILCVILALIIYWSSS
ncbi:unnamed protein product [Cyprideis torosa]|uniref:Uncharacterized protein n=1 Tax=Cyprideis torosa TaxID=163714 RepID=A0A7R8W8H1_9CRUS|nr:unnamed protein product [Cyprideis torosa]CAG0883465.1 unnamed protein product [Cyprideis torosa]